MFENAEDEIAILEQQLEMIKKQDRVLEEIEIRLHQMKKIAKQATTSELSVGEREVLNEQVQAHQLVIENLEDYLRKEF